MANELVKELEYFNTHLDEWLDHSAGQYALVKDNKLLGTFSEFDDAFNQGVTELGITPFLIRKIVEKQLEPQSPALQLGLLNAGS